MYCERCNERSSYGSSHDQAVINWNDFAHCNYIKTPDRVSTGVFSPMGDLIEQSCVHLIKTQECCHDIIEIVPVGSWGYMVYCLDCKQMAPPHPTEVLAREHWNKDLRLVVVNAEEVGILFKFGKLLKKLNLEVVRLTGKWDIISNDARLRKLYPEASKYISKYISRISKILAAVQGKQEYEDDPEVIDVSMDNKIDLYDVQIVQIDGGEIE